MRHLSALIFTTLFLVGTMAPLTVEAKTYPKVQGVSCKSAGAVWRTSFRGARQITLIHETYQWYQAAPCFTSQASCKAWLYNTQTAFPLMMDFVPCHRG